MPDTLLNVRDKAPFGDSGQIFQILAYPLNGKLSKSLNFSFIRVVIIRLHNVNKVPNIVPCKR